MQMDTLFNNGEILVGLSQSWRKVTLSQWVLSLISPHLVQWRILTLSQWKSNNISPMEKFNIKPTGIKFYFSTWRI